MEKEVHLYSITRYKITFMKQFIIFLLFFLPVFIKAQPQQDKLANLHLALKNAANDTTRMDAYGQLGLYYNTVNGDSSLFYLAQSLSIAQKLKLKLYEAWLLQNQGYMLAWSNYPQSLELLLQALKIAEDPASEKNTWNLADGVTPQIARLNVLGYIHLIMGHLYGNTGNKDKQISSYLQAKNLAESVRDTVLNKYANMHLGNVYYSLDKLDSALYFEQKAVSLFSKLPEAGLNDGWVFSAIGQIDQAKGNFDLSRHAFQNGLELMQKQNISNGVVAICILLSSFYKTINKPDSSLLYANKALEIYKLLGDGGGIADAYSSLSSAYDEQKRTDSAFAYLKLAIPLHDSLNNARRKNLLAYQNVTFDDQMRLKKLEEEKIETQTKIRTYSLLAGISVFMLIAFLLYRNNRNRRKANILLQKQKEEIAVQKENVEQTLNELKSTQSQLIQSEKMASLGELTAGIAHEIQNPLNFVNNFSDVNKELLGEMKDEMDKGNIDDAKKIASDVIDNEEKINHHGKRAGDIVKGMLQHSRSTTGVKEPTDINALADEYLRLSYHGLRAKNKNFNAKMKTDFDKSIGKINIIPQDIGRVLLNLFNNAFYACTERSRSTVNQQINQNLISYEPTVSVMTKRSDNNVMITVSDNGNGIPQKIVDKIFQPFFTTKPTGQGTGLGLSLSYDIVKAHGGEIKVETKETKGTEFIIVLPL